MAHKKAEKSPRAPSSRRAVLSAGLAGEGQYTSGEVLRRLMRFARPSMSYLVLALVSAVVSVTLTLLGPVLIGEAVDCIVGPGEVDFAGISRILLLLGLTVLGSGVFQWALSLCTTVVTQRTVREIRTAAFSKLLRVPLKYIDSSSHGDLITRLAADTDQISDGLLQGFSKLFTGVVTIAGTLLFMISINIYIALVVVLITPLSFFVASFIARHSFSKFREQSSLRGEIGGYVEELVGNQKIVKAFGYEERAQAVFDEVNGRLYDCGVMAQFYSSMTNPCTRFVNGLVYAGVGVAGAFSAVSGGLSVGQLSCFLSYANQYTKPFNEISGVITELQTALAAARRVLAVLDEEPEQSDSGVDARPCQGSVSLSQVCFSYRPEQKLIENLTLTAKPGQRIAIVGPTGCGKTTIINLLMRFYDVNSGSIQVDGQDVRSITRSSLRSMYGMVLQESWLFHGTVRDNIAYGRPDATQEEIEAAAKSAHIHSFIRRLPQGYDTILSEDGGNISQGQKQLLCIARIMLTKPPMLILDEATSSIDTRTELMIQEAFGKMMEGRTSFIVAHRLSTIREADCILVMRAGQVVEQGRHEELLEKDGFYARLYNSQFAKNE